MKNLVISFLIDQLLDFIGYLALKNKNLVLQKVSDTLDAIIALKD